MQFTRTNINKTFRNGEVNASNVAITNVGGGGGGSFSGSFLPAVNNGDGSYIVDLSKVVFTGNLIGEGEITAYGQGSTGGGSTSTGSVTIYDGLDSVAVDAALSANQGRILREMILEAGTGGSTLLSKLEDVTLTNLVDGQILKYDAASKKWVNGDGAKITWTNIEGKPADLTDANITKWNENNHTHTNRTTLDKITETSLTNWNDANSKKHSHSNKAVLDGITSTLVTNWNTAYTNNHTHSNKSVLDGITSTKVSNWDGVVTSWNKAFYFDTNGDLKVKVNVIGEKEVSAYGAGVSGGSGSITIVDALTSTATDAALSANQGRILKELIDNVGGGVSSWNDLTDKPVTFAPSAHTHAVADVTGLQAALDAKAASSHTHTIANITNLQTTLDGKAASNHTHNYASTVKVGTSSYAVTGNVISLPAYPTIPTSLKNPNALIISLNGTSQGAYDGSTAKSINITASSIGAAASSHTHSQYLTSYTNNYLTGISGSGNGTVTFTRNGLGNLTWNASHLHNYITSRGNLAPQTGRTQSLGDVYSYNTVSGTTSTGAPATYTSVIGFGKGASGTVEIAGGWTSGMGLWYRALRDVTDNWYGWRKLLDSTNYTDYTVNKTGSGASGTWGISISGNAGSATKLQTTRTIWGQSFDGTANIGEDAVLGAKVIGHLTDTNHRLNLGWAKKDYVDWVEYGGVWRFKSGTNGATTDITFSGGSITARGEVTAYSDARLKTNIKPLENRGYITPVTYKKDDKDSIGFIAQEVQKLYPELVVEGDTDEKYLSLNYSQYVAVLQAQIIELNNRIKQLEEQWH